MSAQVTITIPLSESGIPITGQSLAILTTASILKPKNAALVILSYLVLGFSGLPVFADGSSGIEKLWGNSGGFLYGFLIAGTLLSYAIRAFSDNKFYRILIFTLLATAILLAIGVLHLSVHIGFQKAITYGFLPFWKGGIIKSLLGAMISYTYFIKFNDNIQSA